jgi:hypothetical protein
MVSRRFFAFDVYVSAIWADTLVAPALHSLDNVAVDTPQHSTMNVIKEFAETGRSVLKFLDIAEGSSNFTRQPQ